MNEKSIELKILEWNINGRAGYGNYSIPIFVADETISQDADIVIFTEFVVSMGWDYFKGVLEKKYKIFSTPYISDQNGVLIAIKKDIEGLNYDSIEVVTEMNTNQIEKPNFLQVMMKVKGIPLTIVGVRLRGDNYKNKKTQFDALMEHVLDVNVINVNFVIAGDFNHGAIKYENDQNYDYNDNARKDYNYQMIRKLFSAKDFNMITPDYGKYGRKFSWVMEKPLIKIKEDHISVKGVKVRDEDYLWDFVNPDNGYGGLNKEAYKSHLVGLPDHAILTATIEI